jgi:two-component system LytT family sensor kinase
MNQIYLSGDQLILVSCLVSIGFTACLSSLLVTTRFYRRLLRQGPSGRRDVLGFALSLGVCLGLGVGARVLIGYQGADISLPGTLLAGLVSGPLAGLVAGTLAGGAAVCHGEWLGLPFALVCGAVGGAISRLPGAAEQTWEYSPYPYMNVVRMLRARGNQAYVPAVISLTCLGLDVARTLMTQEFGRENLWSFQPQRSYILVQVWLTTLVTLGVPLKIWNNTRLEMRLKEQEGLAVRARLDALTQQINPHFLFNTLNSISAATRSDPTMARNLIQKLSTILRRVLDKQKNFVPLSEELDYIHSYLDIEVARFGPEKLRIVEDIEPRALHAMVPCMVLQPLVENAVLHAIAPSPDGGALIVRARCDGGEVHIEIADDGCGFDPSHLELEGEAGVTSGGRRRRRGIGLANVHQRLRMAYGRGLEIEAARGRGTRIQFRVPFAPSRELLLEVQETAR